jgi:hypothetical protein
VKLIKQLARKGELRIQRKHEIAQFDGIALVDPDDYTPYFSKIITAALQLIKDTDQRRFHRVQRYIRSIVNCTRPFGGGAFLSETKTCEFEFRIPRSEHDVQFYTAWYACALVHEATHGRLRSRGIGYTPENRTRIEKLCVTEEQRFAKRLRVAPEVLAWLQHGLTFDPRRWQRHWKSTPWKRFILTMRRIRKRYRAQERKNREQGRAYHIPN